MKNLNTYLNRIKIFVQVYKRLVIIASQYVPRYRIFETACLDVFGAVARVAVIAVVAGYVSIKVNNSEISWLNISLSGEIVPLLGVSLIVFGLLISEALAQYASASRIRSFGRIIQTHLANRAIAALSEITGPAINDLMPDQGRMMKYVIRDALQSGIAMENLVRLFRPFVYILASASIVLYLEPQLSLVLALLLLPLAPIVYTVGMGIRTNAEQFYQVRVQEMSQTISPLVKETNNSNLPFINHVRNVKLEEQEPYRNYLDSFDRILLASDRMSMAISIFRSCFIAVGLVAFGWLILYGNRSWGQLVGFVGGLLYLMSSFQSLVGILATLNRLYPQVRDLGNFLNRVELQRNSILSANSSLPNQIVFRSGREIFGSLLEMTLKRGDVSVLVTSRLLQRHELGKFQKMFSSMSSESEEFWNRMSFAQQISLPPSTNLIYAIAGSGIEDRNSTEDKIYSVLSQLEMTDCIEILDNGLDTKLDSDVWQDLPPKFQAGLILTSLAMKQTTGPLMISSSLVQKVQIDDLSRISSLFSNGYLFLTSDLGAMVNLPFDHFLVEKDQRIIGLGNADWISSHKKEIEKIMQVSKNDSQDMFDESLM